MFGQIHQSIGRHQEAKIRAGEFLVEAEEGMGVMHSWHSLESPLGEEKGVWLEGFSVGGYGVHRSTL